jgi:hypothetical protein
MKHIGVKPSNVLLPLVTLCDPVFMLYLHLLDTKTNFRPHALGTFVAENNIPSQHQQIPYSQR